ncbi:hypothetical protein ACOMHN_048753 [Nucella lapillus]
MSREGGMQRLTEKSGINGSVVPVFSYDDRLRQQAVTLDGQLTNGYDNSCPLIMCLRRQDLSGGPLIPANTPRG